MAEIARVIWEACGEDPAAFELEHLPSFEVDVQRRWPSVEKARRLLGWEARIDVREGIASTVEWLRERQLAPRRCRDGLRHGRRRLRRPPPAGAARAGRGGAARARSSTCSTRRRCAPRWPRPSPSVVFHLAALASVRRSWDDPRATVTENVEMTLNLLEAVRLEAPAATVVLAGSGEVYGPPERLPVDEYAPLRPQNPYAVSKAACDLLGGQYADAHGLRVVRTRAFNHAGPGQSDDYVVGTLTRQVAEAEAAGAAEVVLRTGNPDSARDFTDVRDVVRAYVAAAELDPGAYNVCSGRSLSVRELIELVRAEARLPVRHEVDPARVRRPRRARDRGQRGALPDGQRLDARDPDRADGGGRPRRLARGARKLGRGREAPLQLLEDAHDAHAGGAVGADRPRPRARTRRSGRTRCRSGSSFEICGDHTSPERAMYSP